MKKIIKVKGSSNLVGGTFLQVETGQHPGAGWSSGTLGGISDREYRERFRKIYEHEGQKWWDAHKHVLPKNAEWSHGGAAGHINGVSNQQVRDMAAIVLRCQRTAIKDLPYLEDWNPGTMAIINEIREK